MINTPYKNIARNADIERYQLLPFNYTLSYDQAVYGEPLVSPLYYYFDNDTTAVNINDEFMRGKIFLIAPVIHKGETVRKLYLPKGLWYNFYSGEKVIGGKWMNDSVDINHIPVFVKEGSFIPMVNKKNIRTTKDCTTDSLTWNYYASKTASSFTMFDDDGENKNSIAKKEFELITSSVKYSDGIYHFHFSSNGGNFKGKPQKRRIVLIIHGFKANPVIINFMGKPIDINVPAA